MSTPAITIEPAPAITPAPSRLELLLALVREEIDRLVEHQITIDELHTRRADALRQRLQAASERLRLSEEAAGVFDARLADLQATNDRQHEILWQRLQLQDRIISDLAASVETRIRSSLAASVEALAIVGAR